MLNDEIDVFWLKRSFHYLKWHEAMKKCEQNFIGFIFLYQIMRLKLSAHSRVNKNQNITPMFISWKKNQPATIWIKS